MSPPPSKITGLGACLLTALLLTACGGSSTLQIETRVVVLTPLSVSPVAVTPVSSSLGPPTLVPQATPTTSTPPTVTSVPTSGIEFKPATLVQGGSAIVYLNENASSATLRFQDKQYPMLHDGKRWWAIVGVNAFAQPGLLAASVTYTPAGKTESTSVAASINVAKREFPVENIELDDDTAALLDPAIVNAEIAQRAGIFSGFTAQRIWSGPFIAPGQGVISSIYGEGRSYNGGPVTDFHKGTDFAGDTGDPVVAAAAGKVAFTGTLKVRGGTVIIDHGAGVFTAYNHLSEIDVKEGALVKQGERIGAIGSTGLVTGPHLHWEVIVRGVEVDGRLWLQGVEVGP
jgi:murein DD-endopeptidase MepM/ murein hydrolase activator NlpD